MGDSPVTGKPLRVITLPPDSVISIIVRDGKLVIPAADTVLRTGDEVIALTKVDQEANLRRALVG